MATSTEQVYRRVEITSKKRVFTSEMQDVERVGHAQPAKPADDEGSWGSVIWKALLITFCGVAFGVALHKAHVMEPAVIQRQMLMQQFTMMKFFMAALSTSMVMFSLLAVLPFSSQMFQKVCDVYFGDLALNSIASSVLGGILMGLGMTLSGSCPSSIFPQLGALVSNAHYTFLGALAAVVLYSMIKPMLDSLLKPSGQPENSWGNASSYLKLSLPFAAVFGMVAFAFETLIPSKNEIEFTGTSKTSFLAYNVWPPYIGGMMVGSLQIPMALSLYETLGGSTSVSVIASRLFIGPLEKLSPYAARFHGFRRCWQIYYAAGAILGGYISAQASSTLGLAQGMSVASSFWGGFLLYLGTRIGNGCTSGHGLSGMGLLSIVSFVMIGATFASGISSAFVLRHFKLL